METGEIKKLLEKYRHGACTEEEKALLEAWYLQFNEHAPDIRPGKIRAIGSRVFRQLPGNTVAGLGTWAKLALAAGILGLLVTVVLRFVQLPAADEKKKAQDILPGGNSAVLTLSGGRKIALGTAFIGLLASQPGIQVFKTAGGQVSYKQTGVSGLADDKQNNISTPKGGQWRVVLADGSRVWLNSASSLTYSATFAQQKERVVRLAGEAYFEVAKDRLHPFVVKTAGQAVEVLGTHFNINAYQDECSVKTTLAEGRVRVSAPGGTRLLMPGQQAVLENGGLSIGRASIEAALAWKNGYFRFNDEDIGSIMRQLSRWYNIDVAYAGDITGGGLNGRISRFKNIGQVLNALEATGTVRFKIEGRRVTVMK